MNLLKYFLSLTLILGPYAQAWDQATSKVVQVDQASGVSSTPNYWKSGDAELTLTGVSSYAHAGLDKPTTCSGGSSSITATRTSTTPMYDKLSWLITKPSGDLRGHGIAFEFDVDNGISQVEMMDLMFDYIVNSGTFVAGSDTTNSDLMVYVYDVTAGKLIEPYGGSKLYTSATDVKGDYRGWFQSTLGSKKYRVCLHQATTSASAYSLKVDAGKVQKSKQVVGTIITDWESYTPILSNAGNATVSYAKWHRIGPDIIIEGQISIGTISPTGNIGISVPTQGQNPVLSGSFGIVGSKAIASVAATGATYSGIARFDSSSKILNFLGGNGQQFWTASVPFTFANGDGIRFLAKYSIQGWSAGARMSDGYNGQVVAASIILAGSNQTVTSTAETTILYNQIGADPAGMVDLANNGIRVKSSDWYVITTKVVGSTDLAAEAFSVRSKVNGVTLGGGDSRSVSSGTNTSFTAVSPPTYITSGSLVTSSIQSTSDTSYSVAASTGTFLSVVKISGTPFMSPTALWETHYAGTAGDAIGTTSSLIKFTTKVEDTFGSYNPATGLWTAKGPATCSVSWMLYSTAVNLSTSQRYQTDLYKDDTFYRGGSRVYGNGVSNIQQSNGSIAVIPVIQGTTLSIKAISSVSTFADSTVGGSYFTVSCRQSGN